MLGTAGSGGHVQVSFVMGVMFRYVMSGSVTAVVVRSDRLWCVALRYVLAVGARCEKVGHVKLRQVKVCFGGRGWLRCVSERYVSVGRGHGLAV
jgi:hypothetical protein